LNKKSGGMMEQRRNSRIQRQFAALLKRPDTGASTTATIEDISANGLKISMGEGDFVEKEQQLSVIFECEELQFDDNVVLQVIVRGKWKGEDGITHLGVQALPGDNGLSKLEETWLALMFDEIHKDHDISYF